MSLTMAAAESSFDVAAFAQKWTEIYHLLETFSCLQPGDIQHPPHNNLFPSLQSSNLNPLAIEVLQQIPMPAVENDHICLFPNTRPLCYLQPEPAEKYAPVTDLLPWRRNPTADYYSELPSSFPDSNLNSDEIALTTAAEFGKILVLNVVQGTIREIEEQDLTSDAAEPYPADSAVKDAMAVLDEYMAKLRNLEWVPAGDLHPEGVVGEALQDLRDKLERALMQDYGWPDEFQPEAWRSDREDVFYKAIYSPD